MYFDLFSIVSFLEYSKDSFFVHSRNHDQLLGIENPGIENEQFVLNKQAKNEYFYK